MAPQIPKTALYEIQEPRVISLDERIARLGAGAFERQAEAKKRHQQALGAAKILMARLSAELALSRYTNVFCFKLYRRTASLEITRRDISLPLMEVCFSSDGFQAYANVSGVLTLYRENTDAVAELVAEHMAMSLIKIPVRRTQFVNWKLVILSALVASVVGATTSAVLLLI